MDVAVDSGASVAERLEQEIFAELGQQRRRRLIQIWLIRVIGFVVFVGIWYVVAKRQIIDPLLISSPTSVARQMGSQFTSISFWTDVQATFTAAIAGLASGAVLGILAGFALSRLPVLDSAVGPFLTLMNSLPRPAVAPIFILWFGLGALPKTIVGASIVFFLLLTTTRSALVAPDRDVDMLTRSLAMSPRERFTKIDFPSVAPSIVGALRLGAVYSVLGVVVSEMVGAREGLGQRLVIATNNFQVDASFAILIAMGLMSMLLDYAVLCVQWLLWGRK